MDWPQTFTLRLGALGWTPWVSLELLGSSNDRRTSRLKPSVDGFSQSFTFSSGRLKVEGRLLGHDADLAMARMEEISYQGVSICTPGTYQLPSQP